MFERERERGGGISMHNPTNFKNARKYCDACRPLAAAESRRDAAQRRKSGGL